MIYYHNTYNDTLFCNHMYRDNYNIIKRGWGLAKIFLWKYQRFLKKIDDCLKKPSKREDGITRKLYIIMFSRLISFIETLNELPIPTLTKLKLVTGSRRVVEKKMYDATRKIDLRYLNSGDGILYRILRDAIFADKKHCCWSRTVKKNARIIRYR